MDLLVTHPYHALAALFFGYMLFRRLKKARNNPKGLPLPPGPKGYPLIGNLFDMALEKPWLAYDKWFKICGDMVYFNVLGQHILVLGSSRRASDLFEKRSSNYSDRMRLPMMVELMDGYFNLALMPYGSRWRKHRRLMEEYFQRNVVSNYKPIQRRQVRVFLQRLLVTPDNFFLHIRHTFAATIMKIAYGINVQEADDPYISIVEQALDGANQAGIIGAFWVDMFPALKYVPSWFPGAGFQKKAAHWRKINASMVETPFRYVKQQLDSGRAMPSMVSSLIERLPPDDDPQRLTEEKAIQGVAAVAYLAGADTTASTVQSVFLAMALYPDVQKKAQAEIDAVIGPNRLPDFEDRPSLPYISAIVKESLRWNLVGPLGVPHMTTNDDEYDGYYIPKGTIVIGNGWSILHDPETFKNPMEFEPERFLKDGKLNPDVKDPDSAAFGFGRRICPGKYLSDNSLFAIVSCLLAVYDIKPPVDDQGATIKLEPDFSTGLVSSPLPFKCIIKPRTPAAETLIRDSFNEDD